MYNRKNYMVTSKKISISVRFATAIILFLYTLRMLDIRNELYILHDEFAYWAIAAKYAGFNWSGMMKDSGYYSMGYSLLLVPLYHLGVGAALMYKIAIVLNAVFVTISYFISCFVAKKLFQDFSDIEITVSCGLLSLYPYITTQANYAWPEIFLYFLFWVAIFLLCRFAESTKLRWGFLALIESIWMFYVHQRTIGVMIACVLTIFFILWKNREVYKNSLSKRNVLCWTAAFIFILVFAAFFVVLKKYNLNYIFAKADKVQINDFSGQTHKIKALFSMKGITNFLLSLSGKYYYFCVSTVLIGALALFYLIKKSILVIWSLKSIEWSSFIYLFMTLSFLAMISITVIFTMNDYTQEEIITRIDLIFYGRYYEFTLGPLLLVGLHSFKRIREIIPLYFCTIIVFIFTTLSTLTLVGKVQSTNKVDLSAPAFNYFFWHTDNYQKAVLHGATLSIFLFLIVGLLLSCRYIKKIQYGMIIVVIGLMWLEETRTNDDIIKLRESENETYVYDTVAFLRNTKNTNSLSYIYSDKDRNWYQRYAFYIQFNLHQYNMQKIERTDLDGLKPEKDAIYIVMEDSSLKDEFNTMCELLYSNERVNLFGLKEKP